MKKLLKKESYVVAAADSGSALSNQLGTGKRESRGGGGDRKALSLGAGLHFLQRHLGAPGAREKPGWGRCGPRRPIPRPGARRSAAWGRGAPEPGPLAAPGRAPRAPAPPGRNPASARQSGKLALVFSLSGAASAGATLWVFHSRNHLLSLL